MKHSNTDLSCSPARRLPGEILMFMMIETDNCYHRSELLGGQGGCWTIFAEHPAAYMNFGTIVTLLEMVSLITEETEGLMSTPLS